MAKKTMTKIEYRATRYGMAKEGVGHKVKQFGATCGECHRKMGHGTIGVVVRHGLSHFYYHPACFQRRKSHQYPGHMI